MKQLLWKYRPPTLLPATEMEITAWRDGDLAPWKIVGPCRVEAEIELDEVVWHDYPLGQQFELDTLCLGVRALATVYSKSTACISLQLNSLFEVDECSRRFRVVALLEGLRFSSQDSPAPPAESRTCPACESRLDLDPVEGYRCLNCLNRRVSG